MFVSLSAEDQYLATTGPLPTGALPTVVQPATLTTARIAAIAIMDFFIFSPCYLQREIIQSGESEQENF